MPCDTTTCSTALRLSIRVVAVATVATSCICAAVPIKRLADSECVFLVTDTGAPGPWTLSPTPESFNDAESNSTHSTLPPPSSPSHVSENATDPLSTVNMVRDGANLSLAIHQTLCYLVCSRNKKHAVLEASCNLDVSLNGPCGK